MALRFIMPHFKSGELVIVEEYEDIHHIRIQTKTLDIYGQPTWIDAVSPVMRKLVHTFTPVDLGTVYDKFHDEEQILKENSVSFERVLSE